MNIKDYPPPAWLPDWADESAYEDHGDDLECWAWEFLRRNPEYQADYARWAALPDTEIAEDRMPTKSAKYKTGVRLQSSMIFYHAEPPAIEGETVEQYEARTGQSVTETIETHMCNKWGVMWILDPEKAGHHVEAQERATPPIMVDFPDSYLECGPRNTQYGSEYMAGRLLYAPWPEDDDSFMFTFGFDVRVSIPDQLRAVEQTLLELKREMAARAEDDMLSNGYEEKRRAGLPQRGSYIPLLRLLDAVQSGADDEAIVSEIYPGEAKPVPAGRGQRAKEALEDEQARFLERGIEWKRKALPKALELLNSGYRHLLYWAKLPPQQREKPHKRGK